MSSPRPSRQTTSSIFPGWAAWLRAFLPASVAVDRREQMRAALGAAIGIFVTALMCHRLCGPALAASPWLIAPMGASAVLVFAAPVSPLAQPWPVIGGNTLSALVGIACARWIDRPELAASVAVGSAIALMFALRCLHPPGGASALLMVLAGISNFGFAFYPVLVNALVLTLAGIAYNHATGRAYPHVHVPAPKPERAGALPSLAPLTTANREQ